MYTIKYNQDGNQETMSDGSPAVTQQFPNGRQRKVSENQGEYQRWLAAGNVPAIQHYQEPDPITYEDYQQVEIRIDQAMDQWLDAQCFNQGITTQARMNNLQLEFAGIMDQAEIPNPSEKFLLLAPLALWIKALGALAESRKDEAEATITGGGVITQEQMNAYQDFSSLPIPPASTWRAILKASAAPQ